MRFNSAFICFILFAAAAKPAVAGDVDKYVWIKQSSVVDHRTDLPLHHVKVSVIKNETDTVFTCYTDKQGKHEDLKLEYDKTYKVLYTCSGFISRYMAFNTHTPAEFKLHASWLKISQKLIYKNDISACNEHWPQLEKIPAVKIRYDKGMDAFTFDLTEGKKAFEQLKPCFVTDTSKKEPSVLDSCINLLSLIGTYVDLSGSGYLWILPQNRYMYGWDLISPSLGTYSLHGDTVIFESEKKPHMYVLTDNHSNYLPFCIENRRDSHRQDSIMFEPVGPKLLITCNKIYYQQHTEKYFLANRYFQRCATNENLNDYNPTHVVLSNKNAVAHFINGTWQGEKENDSVYFNHSYFQNAGNTLNSIYNVDSAYFAIETRNSKAYLRMQNNDGNIAQIEILFLSETRLALKKEDTIIAYTKKRK